MWANLPVSYSPSASFLTYCSGKNAPTKVQNTCQLLSNTRSRGLSISRCLKPTSKNMFIKWCSSLEHRNNSSHRGRMRLESHGGLIIITIDALCWEWIRFGKYPPCFLFSRLGMIQESCATFSTYSSVQQIWREIYCSEGNTRVFTIMGNTVTEFNDQPTDDHGNPLPPPRTGTWAAGSRKRRSCLRVCFPVYVLTVL